ncbi:MAG: anti-sigma factor, partial [Solirubrobacteraceae bacterium]
EGAQPGGSCGDAPLYALGLLQPHEVESFLEHVQACVVCRDEIGALEAAVDSLGESVPQLRAPRQVKRGVMEAIEAETSVSASLAGRRARKGGRLRIRSLQPLAVAATALAVLVLGGAIGVLSFGSSSPQTVTSAAEVSYPNASATLHRSGSHLWLTVAHMPSPGKGRVYEVWLQRGKGTPIPTAALFTPTTSGAADVVVPSNVSGASEVLVTSEPEGGTLKPTRSPVIVGRLSS